MRRLLQFALFLILTLPGMAQTIYLSTNESGTQTSSNPYHVPKGTPLDVDAIVNGTANKGVTWTTSAGTMINSNCSSNYPCTVGLSVPTSNTSVITLTATSHANSGVSKSTYIKFDLTPAPTGTAPDFLITTLNLSAMQAKAVNTNPMWAAWLGHADSYWTQATTYYNWSLTCTGGSGLPGIDPGGAVANIMFYAAAADLLGDTSHNWHCLAHDTVLWSLNNTANGSENFSANTWSDGSYFMVLGTAWAIKSGAISSAEYAQVRPFLAWTMPYLAPRQGTTPLADSTKWNSSQMFQTGDQFQLGAQRAMGSNYSMGKYMWDVAVALMFNDNTTTDPLMPTNGILQAQVNSIGTGYNAGDKFNIGSCGAIGQLEPLYTGGPLVINITTQGSSCSLATAQSTTPVSPATGSGLTVNITYLSNTCGAARGAICTDYTAGSLHSYFGLANQAFLRAYAHFEDPAITYPVLNAAYPSGGFNAPVMVAFSAPYPGGTTYDAFGDGWGGESAEGSWYYYSLYRLRNALNIVSTAGYDDPLTYGPQVTLGYQSFWDMNNWGQGQFTTGTYALNGVFNALFGYFTTGDAGGPPQRIPNDFLSQSALLTFDSEITQRTDRNNADLWFTMGFSNGGIAGTAGGCSSNCGFINNMSVDAYGEQTVFDMFISQPATDPTVTPPTDPRASYPTDWWVNGWNQHQEVRSGFAQTDTIFSAYGSSNTLIDHEAGTPGRFDVWFNGGMITTGRTTFTGDYYWSFWAASAQNMVAIYDAPGNALPIASLSPCFAYYTGPYGGEQFHSYQRGLFTVPTHSEAAGYSSFGIDQTNNQNGCYLSGGWAFVDTTQAYRDIVFLRGSNQVVWYDRDTTASSASLKSLWMNTPTNATASSNTVSWTSLYGGSNKAKFTSLLPSGATVAASKLINYVVATAPFSSLHNGSTMQGVCTATYADGTTANLASTSGWWSDTPSVATVSTTGLVTAVGVGSATIGCTQGQGSFTGPQPVDPNHVGFVYPNFSYGTLSVISGSSSGTFTGTATTTQNQDPEAVGALSVTPSGTPTAVQFLSFLSWTTSAGTPATATLVQSSAGQNFDGAVSGSNLVMFSRTVPLTFTGTTIPVTGAGTLYVADLAPNTAYSASGAGVGASVTSDAGGVAVLSPSSAGSVVLSPGSGPPAAPVNLSGHIQISGNAKIN